MNAKDVEEYQSSSGFGVNGNFKDFKQDTQVNHLLPVSKQSAAITTTNLNFNQDVYEAKSHTTINGKAGTNLDIKHSIGTVISDKDDGKEVTKNESHSYDVVIPHMTKETKEQFSTNAKWAEKKLVEAEKKITDFFSSPRKDDREKYRNNSRKHEETNKNTRVNHPDESSNKKQHDKETYDPNKSKSESTSPEEQKKNTAEVNSFEISDKEAYAMGKSAGIRGQVPEYINDWPEDLKGQFYLGMGEGQSIKDVGIAFLGGIEGLASRMVFDLARLGIRTFGLFQKVENLTETVFHTAKDAEAAQNIVDGIDPFYIDTANRFGEAFYTSEKPETTLLELQYHDAIGEFTITFSLDYEAFNILDLTDTSIANEWGYIGGNDYTTPQQIANKAKELGFDAIKFPSERGEGNNYAFFGKFEYLKPENIFPTPDKYESDITPKR